MRDLQAVHSRCLFSCLLHIQPGAIPDNSIPLIFPPGLPLLCGQDTSRDFGITKIPTQLSSELENVSVGEIFVYRKGSLQELVI